MRKLTRFIAPAIIAAATLGGAGVATAQPYGGQPYGGHSHEGQRHFDDRTPGRANAIRAQIDELQRRVDRNDNRGRISEREARALRQDIRQLQNQFRFFNRDGLDGREMRILDNRIDNIRGRLHIERRDWNGRRW